MSLKLVHIEFEKFIPEKFNINPNIKLCFLDPPDNERRRYENYSDNLDNNEYIRLLRIWIDNACRITYGPVFISFAEKWIPYVEIAIKEMRIPLIQRIWWKYNFGQANKTRYTPCVRPIYWLNKATIYPDQIKIPSARQIKYNDKRAASGGKLPPNIWEFPRVCGTFKEKRKWHVTQHPELLIKRIILGHSVPNDYVLDGFIGSGTTAYVCKELRRHCIGVDISKFYLEKISEIYDGR